LFKAFHETMEKTMFVRKVSRSSRRGLLVAACAAVLFAAAPVGAALAHGGGHGGGGHGGGGHSSSSSSHGGGGFHSSGFYGAGFRGHDHDGRRMAIAPDPGDAADGGSWSLSDPRCWDGATLLCGS
jgi:hypothetical protein